MKACPGKERQSSNYFKNIGRLQEENKTQQAKERKIIKGISKRFRLT